MANASSELYNFGSSLREKRSSAGLSQEALAIHAGLDRTYVSDVERGNRNISLKNIYALARALNIPVAELFPSNRSLVMEDSYRHAAKFNIDCGFIVTGHATLAAVIRSNNVIEALPTSLFRTVDFKSQSGMVGAIFSAELASEVSAIPNPIEKGHPDILPLSASNASEALLRNYPEGLEVKSTVGTIRKGVVRQPCSARIQDLTGITWQAHHREVGQLMGLTWDYVDGTSAEPSPPLITGVFYSDKLTVDDWGEISGTTGRNTKVTGMRSSARRKMALGTVVAIDRQEYLRAFASKLGPLPAGF